MESCNRKRIMAKKTIVPNGENLRDAIRWLSEQSHLPKNVPQQISHQRDQRAAVEKASVLFDLTPMEEEFLIRKFVTIQSNDG